MKTAYLGGKGGTATLPDGGELLLGATDESQGTLNWTGSPASYHEGLGDILAKMRLIADAAIWSLPNDKQAKIVFNGPLAANYLVRCDFQVGLVNSPTDQIMSGGIAVNSDLVGQPLVSSNALVKGCLPIECKFTTISQYWLHAVRKVSLVPGDTLSLVLANTNGQDTLSKSANVSFVQVK